MLNVTALLSVFLHYLRTPLPSLNALISFPSLSFSLPSQFDFRIDNNFKVLNKKKVETTKCSKINHLMTILVKKKTKLFDNKLKI